MVTCLLSNLLMQYQDLKYLHPICNMQLYHGCTQRGVWGGRAEPFPPRNLADQLTLSKPGGKIIPLTLSNASPPPPDSKNYLHLCQRRSQAGARGARVPQKFGRSINPIQTRGEDYAPHTIYCQPPGFKKLSTPLLYILPVCYEFQYSLKIYRKIVSAQLVLS